MCYYFHIVFLSFCYAMQLRCCLKFSGRTSRRCLKVGRAWIGGGFLVEVSGSCTFELLSEGCVELRKQRKAVCSSRRGAWKETEERGDLALYWLGDFIGNGAQGSSSG